MRSNKISLAVLSFLFLWQQAAAQQKTGLNAGEIRQSLAKLQTLGSVMYVAAHPDDENTRLLSYLSNELKFRTVYLSMTRGDGGQNLIGKEQGVRLGMIRTHELMEARKIDGAEQFFTRANDFGFSKNPEETFDFWNKEEILSDVVYAIRKFRPDVIINRFPTTGEGGHGHHTASAILAVEAFRAAGDPLRFPEQLKRVAVWQPKRIFFNSFNFRGAPRQDTTGLLKLDVGGYNPLLGISYGELAAASRSMHKSQGFGVAVSRGQSIEHFRKQDGDTAVSSLFENIPTGWSRVNGGAAIDKLIIRVIREFNDLHPELSVPLLTEILGLVRKLDDKYWKEVKEQEVLQLIKACAGLWFEANAASYFATPGDTITIQVACISRTMPGIGLEKVSVQGKDTLVNLKTARNEMLTFPVKITLSGNLPYSTPYWLNESYTPGRYTVADPEWIGRPDNDPSLIARFHVDVSGTWIEYTVPVTHKWTDPVKGELNRPFEVLPPVSVKPSETMLVFTGNEKRTFNVEVFPARAGLKGTLKVKAPAGWKITPSDYEVSFKDKGDAVIREFTVESLNGLQPAAGLEISFESEGQSHGLRVDRIGYDHIPPLTLITPAVVRMVPLSFTTRAKKIGYIEGAGDDVANCLKQAGFDVTILDERAIMREPLSVYDAIITGVRAYNTLENMELFYPKLMDYVENGGNLVVQYNTSNFISTVSSSIGPYPFRITRDRVTMENAPVSFTDPGHFLLNDPNKITLSDFEGWVQERGLYFAGELSSEYKTVISMNDPGEEGKTGSIIIAPKGKGYFIYSGISFFRQLPAGVPGAYRLLVNMINAGKSQP